MTPLKPREHHYAAFYKDLSASPGVAATICGTCEKTVLIKIEIIKNMLAIL
jgi:hypothetical protein